MLGRACCSWWPARDGGEDDELEAGEGKSRVDAGEAAYAEEEENVDCSL
jgi:hypothetical protein